MLTGLQYSLLKRLAPAEPRHCSGASYRNRSKLRAMLGDCWLEELPGKVVVDFGCGEGCETVELAERGALLAIGIDIRETLLARARQHAAASPAASRCRFASRLDHQADAVVTLDAFEHFDRPADALRAMFGMLKPGGMVLAAFGPTWYHPYGGHLFSVFPWAHLLFSEPALIRWRSDIRSDGATCFREVEGGLNQMTLRRFERLVEASGFAAETIDAVPIRGAARFHNRLTREFLTAIVRARLVKPRSARAMQPAA